MNRARGELALETLSAARAKAVTSRTASPHSKTWRQIGRFKESEIGRGSV